MAPSIGLTATSARARTGPSASEVKCTSRAWVAFHLATVWLTRRGSPTAVVPALQRNAAHRVRSAWLVMVVQIGFAPGALPRRCSTSDRI